MHSASTPKWVRWEWLESVCHAAGSVALACRFIRMSSVGAEAPPKVAGKVDVLAPGCGWRAGGEEIRKSC